jgi:ferric-dicitrate binding protein FerR (iron transport regulator)
MRATVTDWRRTLRDMSPAAVPRPAHLFWPEFHARRALPPRPEGTTAVAFRSPLRFLAPALAAAAVVAAAVGGAIWWRPREAATMSRVESYSIHGKYTSVMLLTEESTQATILWINGLEPDDDGDES